MLGEVVLEAVGGKKNCFLPWLEGGAFLNPFVFVGLGINATVPARQGTGWLSSQVNGPFFCFDPKPNSLFLQIK